MMVCCSWKPISSYDPGLVYDLLGIPTSGLIPITHRRVDLALP